MPSALQILFAAALCGPILAQACSSGDLLLKNDSLPAIPGGATAVAIVPGLCEGEAAMAALTAPGPVWVNKVSVMFAQAQGTNGVTAAVDMEIYDGATVNAQGRWTLGPLVYRLSNGGSNLQIATHAINEHTLPTPVRCVSGKVVVGWRMVLTTASGSCALGYTSNFATDFGAGCVAGRNIIDAIGHGPIDPATYLGFGLPMCPLYFRGDWIIRACVTPDVNVTWSGTPTPGGAVLLTLQAPGHAGRFYVTMLSLGTTPGWATPWGTIPLNPDFLLECSLTPNCANGLLLNGAGTLNAMAQAYPVVLIPPLPILVGSGLTFHAGFVTSSSPTWVPFAAISPPSSPIVVN